MHFIDQPWPWFFMGAIIAGSLTWLCMWTRSRNISITWYEWLIGLLGVLLLAISAQNVWAAIEEMESQAKWFHLLVFGFPGLLLLLVSIQLVRRHKTA